jgi:tetratricopeptide (TPR) repeat protein
LKDYRLPNFGFFGFITPREACDGIVLQKLGESAQAQSSLERARELAAAAVTARPDDPKALRPIEQDALDGVVLRNRLALIYAKTGENARALDLLQKVAKLPFARPTVIYSTPTGIRSATTRVFRTSFPISRQKIIYAT